MNTGLRPVCVRGLAGCVLAAAIAGSPLTARAHERSASYAEFRVDAAGAAVTLRIESRDLTRLPESAEAGPGRDSAVGDVIAAALIARRGQVACTPSTPVVRAATSGGRETLRWRVECPGDGSFGVESRLTQLLRAPHLCFVMVRTPANGDFEVVLHSERAQWQQPEAAEASGQRAFLESFRLGVEHIAGGADHLFFVFGLVVVAATLSEVAVVITAFTLAHMLTLATAALGLLRPAAASVEALIAVSIALVAVENLTLRAESRERGRRHPSAAAALVLAPALLATAAQLGRVPAAPLAGTAVFALSYLAFADRRPTDRRVRWVVAFVFGLLHGFGFAGVLVEAGFSGAAVATTLVAFNAGVEIGQLLFVALLWPLLTLLRRRAGVEYTRLVVEPASVVLLAASVAWYAARAFG